MKHLVKNYMAKFFSFTVCFSLIIFPYGLQALETTCDKGVHVPPFLEAGVISNALLIIDNSASMYDLAYVDLAPANPADLTFNGGKPVACYDENYNQTWDPVTSAYIAAEPYEGYFEVNGWYYYDLATSQFVKDIDQTAAEAKCNTGDSKYTKAGELCISNDETPGALVPPQPHILKGFAARGNFLNWASASKFDIEKKILTGGKYDSTNKRLVMENRGCLDKKFIKQVVVQNSASVDHHLALGIGSISDTDDTTAINVYEVTVDGVVVDDCVAAVDEFLYGNLGQVSQKTEDCMLYTNKDKALANAMNAYNHSLHACYTLKDEGAASMNFQGYVSSMTSDCTKVWAEGTKADLITPANRDYICAGTYQWPSGVVPEGQKPKYIGDCAADGGAGVDYFDSWADPAAIDACIEKAIIAYCDWQNNPEVIDPSDASDDTSDTWNLPAILMDTALDAQLGEPIAILKGHISEPTTPTGLVQDYSSKLRIGVMAFNDFGASTECQTKKTDPDYAKIAFACDAAEKDGAKLLAKLDSGTAHTTTVADSINNIKAKTWTPMAEAVLNALGYYGQWSDGTESRNLNPGVPGVGDYQVSQADDPVQAWCQNNNILIITDGGSTADVATKVSIFSGTYGDGDTDTENCDGLFGSTYLDDITQFAAVGTTTDIYDFDISTYDTDYDKRKNISTYIVVAGTARDDGTTTDECNPKTLLKAAAIDVSGNETLYESSNYNELVSNLRKAFYAMSIGASSGSAASVISSSRGGEGAVYQAIFWKEYDNTLANIPDISWVGEVHSMLMDENGFMYEDTNADDKLDKADDSRVTFFWDSSVEYTRVCPGVFDGLGQCCIDLDSSGACTGLASIKELSDVKYLWSANEWLSNITQTDTLTNRAVGSYISDEKKRYIFTWNDLDNDGIVDETAGADNEVLPFQSSVDWAGFSGDTAASRGSVVKDFGSAMALDSDVDEIVNWVRGFDDMDTTVGSLRDRQVVFDTDGDADYADETAVTWRLGDVIHSTPMVVSRPAEGYHILYRDSSYGSFVNKWNNRRTMIYFGANDGMLHAVNGGYFDADNTMFCRTEACTIDTANAALAPTFEKDTAGTPELGAELWAYVPYNLTPHLKCLTDEDYKDNHKYYVDLRPRIFDVKIFTEEAICATNVKDVGCLHPGGWGTILVGGMRFGGAPVSAADLNGLAGTDDRVFTSAYFIMDVTNPEAPPVLLAEMTNTGYEGEMGYTAAIPTMVLMKDDTTTPSTYKWYLVLGSGPTDPDGLVAAGQTPKVAVFPLDRLVGTRKNFRIPDYVPDSTDEFGRYDLGGDPGFVSDLVTVDYDLDVDYKSDVVYFGTVEDNSGNWEGKLYRLVTNEESSGEQLMTKPSDWPSLLTKARSSDWAVAATAASSADLTNPLPLIDLNQPVTAAPNVTSDGTNFWVYFGTGRFFSKADKLDASQQSYYGIKEPRQCSGTSYSDMFDWATVEKTGAHGSTTGTPGDQGLLDVTNINVRLSASASISPVYCNGNTADSSCLPDQPYSAVKLTNFQQLTDYVAGTGCDISTTPSQHTGTDGWRKDFKDARERNLGQATLLGGLVTFTTYQPHDDICKMEGEGYLYGVYYQTGTAFYRPVFGYDSSTNEVYDKLSTGRGLSPTPNLHIGKDGVTAVLQTSTGEIIAIKQQEQAIQNIKTGKTSWREMSP